MFKFNFNSNSTNDNKVYNIKKLVNATAENFVRSLNLASIEVKEVNGVSVWYTDNHSLKANSKLLSLVSEISNNIYELQQNLFNVARMETENWTELEVLSEIDDNIDISDIIKVQYINIIKNGMKLFIPVINGVEYNNLMAGYTTQEEENVLRFVFNEAIKNAGENETEIMFLITLFQNISLNEGGDIFGTYEIGNQTYYCTDDGIVYDNSGYTVTQCIPELELTDRQVIETIENYVETFNGFDNEEDDYKEDKKYENYDDDDDDDYDDDDYDDYLRW